jgi:LPS sulfotransferase NodH
VKLHWYQFDELPFKLGQVPGLEGLTPYGMMTKAFGDPRYVFLTRQDKARQAVSFYRATRTRVWWKIEDQPEQEPAVGASELAYDYAAIERLEQQLWSYHEAWQRYFDENGIEPVRVVYEDLEESYEATVLEVLRALGIALPAGLSVPRPRLRKQADGLSEDWVERYREDRVGRTVAPGAPREPTPPSPVEGGRAPIAAAGARISALDHPWKRWVAENRLLRIDEALVLEVLAGQGLTRPQAIAEVRSLAIDPLYQGGDRVAQRFHKLRSLLKVYGALGSLSASARTVERRSGVTRDEFLESYYARNHPVVLTGAAADWPATRNWDPTYLKAACGDVMVEIMAGRGADPRYELNSERHKQAIRFADYVDMVANGGASNDYYLVANNLFFHRPEAGVRRLLDDVTPLPDFLAPDRLDRHVHFWFGPGGTVTPLHHDTINILIAQVSGRKHFKLVPSWQIGLVYNTIGVYSDVDCEDPDLERYPLFEDATVIDVALEPGEALFLPVGWWHHVRALDVSMSLSFTNFVFPNHYEWDNPHLVP